MQKSIKLKDSSPSPKKFTKMTFNEKVKGFDRKSSQVLYDSMKLSRKYTSQNTAKEDAKNENNENEKKGGKYYSN